MLRPKPDSNGSAMNAANVSVAEFSTFARRVGSSNFPKFFVIALSY
jgi:hypothetical protein